jgi:hypothetical protein
MGFALRTKSASSARGYAPIQTNVKVASRAAGPPDVGTDRVVRVETPSRGGRTGGFTGPAVAVVL